MSHFLLAVILEEDDIGNLDDIMEQYNENREVEKYIKYTKEEAINKAKELIIGNLERGKRQLAEEEKAETPHKKRISRIKESINYYQKKG